MKHIMLDLETFGKTSGCVPTVLAAVEFDPLALVPPYGTAAAQPPRTFMRRIDVLSSLLAGLRVEQGTVDWWRDQPKEAQEALFHGSHVSLKDAVKQFAEWLGDDIAGLFVWAKSPGFDCAIWRAACVAVGENDTPWKFRNEVDVRALEQLPLIGNFQPPPVPMQPPPMPATQLAPLTKHNALHDCWFQINIVQKGFERLHNGTAKKQA